MENETITKVLYGRIDPKIKGRIVAWQVWRTDYYGYQILTFMN